MDNQTLIDIATDCLRRASNVSSYLIYMDGTEPLMHERRTPTLPQPIVSQQQTAVTSRNDDARLPNGFWRLVHKVVQDVIHDNPSKKIHFFSFHRLKQLYDNSSHDVSQEKIRSAISNSTFTQEYVWRTHVKTKDGASGVEISRGKLRKMT